MLQTNKSYFTLNFICPKAFESCFNCNSFVSVRLFEQKCQFRWNCSVTGKSLAFLPSNSIPYGRAFSRQLCCHLFSVECWLLPLTAGYICIYFCQVQNIWNFSKLKSIFKCVERILFEPEEKQQCCEKLFKNKHQQLCLIDVYLGCKLIRSVSFISVICLFCMVVPSNDTYNSVGIIQFGYTFSLAFTGELEIFWTPENRFELTRLWNFVIFIKRNIKCAHILFQHTYTKRPLSYWLLIDVALHRYIRTQL